MNTTATDLFTPANTDHDTRGHKYKLMQSHCRIDVRKYIFLCGTICLRKSMILVILVILKVF